MALSFRRPEDQHEGSARCLGLPSWAAEGMLAEDIQVLSDSISSLSGHHILDNISDTPIPMTPLGRHRKGNRPFLPAWISWSVGAD